MGKTPAIMFTITTYGTWLRGDQRGWVEKGKILPADPELEAADRRQMKHPIFLFHQDQLLEGSLIGKSLRRRLNLRILAMTVQTWHVHGVIAATERPVPKVVKCAKDAVRWGLRPGRPIWSDGYDKRFCFDDATVHRRLAYVERHNTQHGWPPKPWDFIEPI